MHILVLAAGLLAVFAISDEIWTWVHRLGGLGLVLFGFADSSPIPTPGGMDLLLIVLAGSQPEWWWYYSGAAVVGALVGAEPSYRLGRKGGKEMLEKRFPKKHVQKVYRKFEDSGYWAAVVPALMPPPIPLSPFIMGAGALKIPRLQFYAALGIAKAIRYALVGYFASLYGRQVYEWVGPYTSQIFWTLIVLLFVGGGIGGYFIWKHRKKLKQLTDQKKQEEAGRPATSANEDEAA